MTDVSFRVSSGLKNIIGKELITDDFIAVFELVKNSFDANARNVEIVFQKLRLQSPYIVIKDDGDGMDEIDLRDKWLFVAYSSKKLEQDYRDKIKSGRVYAGAKGIGRFSCDRLGAKLKLRTRKKTDSACCHVLTVDWNRFEEDPEKEFQTIEAELSEVDAAPFFQSESGTILEISNLRSKDWDRDKLLRLRRSLERLINPNQGNDVGNFSITLTVPDELQEDARLAQSNPNERWNIVNGPIKNFVFETLELRTTQIQLEIDEDGHLLRTQLNDRGTLIYGLTENNPYPILCNIRINLFFLNKSAKYSFARHMGLPNVRYGSVFLYKNGFRIHPFGDVGDDSLGIDRRKQQGAFRFLGSRELIGRIEISGANPNFQETSSRDGGLIKNEAFDNLKKLFFDYALKRLENYAIELARFGKGLEDLPELQNSNSQQLKQIVFDIIVKLTRSADVVDIDYDPHVLNILENRSVDSVTGLLKNLSRIATEQNDEKLYQEVSKAERQVVILKKAKEEAETETEQERERARLAEQEAKQSYAKSQELEEEARKAQAATRIAQIEANESKEQVKVLHTQTLFLKSFLSKDVQHLAELQHSIGQDARAIEQFSTNLLGLLKDETKQLKPEKIHAVLERICYVARKIITVSRFATQANFRADAEDIVADLTAYIREYLLNIYEGFVLDPYHHRINIEFSPPNGAEFITRFTPINVSIILDNLISNSRKHKSKTISVDVIRQQEDELIVSFKDDGQGIPRKNIPFLFDIGFTTTDGSGLGLHHSQTIMQEMQGRISVNEEYKDGAEFLLAFKRQ